MSTLAPSDDVPLLAPAPAPRPRSTLGVAAVVVGLVFAIAAVGLGVLGVVARSDASSERSAASSARRTRRTVHAHHDEVTREWGELASTYSSLTPTIDALLRDMGELNVDQQRFIAAADQANALRNAGDPASAAAAFRSSVQPTLDELRIREDETQRVLGQAHDAIDEMRQAQ